MVILGWRTAGVAKQAFEDLIRGLQSLAEFLIRFGLCALPSPLLDGPPLYLTARSIGRRRQDETATASPEQAIS